MIRLYNTKLTASGQISLPKEAREHIGVNPGDKVNLIWDGKDLKVIKELTSAEFFAILDSMDTPENKAAKKKYAGLTASELRNLPESKKYYERKYGVRHS